MSLPCSLQEYFAVPRAVLAPMAGYTDRVFRLLCFSFGAQGGCTEMVSAKGLCYESRRTEALLSTYPEEVCRGAQLFGSDPASVAEAVKRITDQNGEYGFDFIDLNCGCPARKIVTNGDGSALMGDPALAAKVIRAAAENTSLPVTVKFRLGTDEAHINAVAFARMAEENGACLLTLHPRTAAQGYSGKADWSRIREVKQAVRVPVVGNGDVTDGASALEMLRQTGCDGVMAGRAALGNPWLFREIAAAFSGTAYTPPTVSEIAQTALLHAERISLERGQRSLVELRKHLPLYFAGRRGAGAYRTRLSSVSTLEELRSVLLDIEEHADYNK